jgi:methionine sulfoxide reductase catalytic subunit
MMIKRKRGWEIAEARATPESVFFGRRAVLGGAAAAAGVAACEVVGARPARAGWLFSSASVKPVELAPMPAPQNATYKPGRALTPEKAATTYNNFYEFSESKDCWGAAQRLPVSPWNVAVDGLVEKPFTIGLEDLMKKAGLEERLYRHRCVEAWAMTVPWTGFPLSKLVALAKPTSAAKFVQFTSLADAKTMPGLGESFYPWPYTEGLTMAEAMNDLAFMVVGMYGHVVPPQDGAAIRLATPWKYGFKSAKSIVRVTFTDKQPKTFWQALQASEYGFWANVNPDVPHPRWSQARERLIGTGDMVPTVIYNGYGEFVAPLYADMIKAGVKPAVLFR